MRYYALPSFSLQSVCHLQGRIQPTNLTLSQPTNLTLSQPTNLTVSTEVGPHPNTNSNTNRQKSDRVPSNAGHPLDPPLISLVKAAWNDWNAPKILCSFIKQILRCFCSTHQLLWSIVAPWCAEGSYGSSSGMEFEL